MPKSKTRIHTQTPFTITNTPINAFDGVLVNTVDPLPRTENGTLIFDLTKYLVAIPVANKTQQLLQKLYLNLLF